MRFHKQWTAPDGLAATRLIGAPPRCGVFFPLSVRASDRLQGLEALGARGGSTQQQLGVLGMLVRITADG